MTATCSTRAYLLTPPGAGAIGIIRLTGPQAESIALELFRPRRGRRGSIAPARLRYGSFVVHGERLDDVIVSSSVLKSEPVVDFCAHGGIRIMERLLEALSSRGVDVATNAEERPCPWPATNLIECEAACALASARTGRAAKFLARQFGALPNTVRDLAASCASAPARADALLGELLRHYADTRHLINGATVSLIGPTNSGKSTLFNRLVGRRATVVSAEAGTTRDWACEPIELAGVGIDLIDTAGAVRHGTDLERAAVSEGHRRASGADLRLIVLDGSTSLPDHWMKALDGWLTVGPALLIRTKADLPAAWSASTLPTTPTLMCSVSAHSGTGLSELAATIEQAICPVQDSDTWVSVFTERQVTLLQRARAALATDPAETARLLLTELLNPERAKGDVQA